MPYDPISEEDERIAHETIGAAIEVHRVLGPGFLESVYQKALIHELKLHGLNVEFEKPLIVYFKDLVITGQRLDLLVHGRLIVELESAEEISPIFLATLLSYLKAPSLRLGLIINFNVEVLKHGIKRVVR